MGEIANMMINGLLCQGCGVYMDDFEEPGYPRICKDCEPYYEEENLNDTNRKDEKANEKEEWTSTTKERKQNV